MELHYNNRDLLNEAFKAVDGGSDFSILVTGWKARMLIKSIPMYIKYFVEREARSGKKKIAEIFKFAPYGIMTPEFWGIINHASMAGMRVDYQMKENAILVFFKNTR